MQTVITYLISILVLPKLNRFYLKIKFVVGSVFLEIELLFVKTLKFY